MWARLEESLISCHKLRAATFQQPRGRVINKCEEAPQNSFTGCAETEATIAATRRKRILQQLLALHGRQDRDQQQHELRQALCGDPLAEWAAWGMLPLDKATLEMLVARAQELQEETRQEACDARKSLGGPG